MRELPALGSVDAIKRLVDNTIAELRQRRLWMVKSESEYVTIFACLHQRLQGHGQKGLAWAPILDAANLLEALQEPATSGGSAAAASGKEGSLENYTGVGFQEDGGSSK